MVGEDVAELVEDHTAAGAFDGRFQQEESVDADAAGVDVDHAAGGRLVDGDLDAFFGGQMLQCRVGDGLVDRRGGGRRGDGPTAADGRGIAKRRAGGIAARLGHLDAAGDRLLNQQVEKVALPKHAIGRY